MACGAAVTGSFGTGGATVQVALVTGAMTIAGAYAVGAMLNYDIKYGNSATPEGALGQGGNAAAVSIVKTIISWASGL